MFRMGSIAGRTVLEVDGTFHDVATVAGDESLADPMAAVARFVELSALSDKARGAGAPVAGPLGVCVPRPSKVFGIGLNYKSHASESKMELPPAPMTTTNSTSQSTVSPDSTTSSVGPTRQLGNFVKVNGAGGSSILDSLACDL